MDKLPRRLLLTTCVALLSACATSSSQQHPSSPGAYMIVIGDVHDRAALRDGYAAKLPPLYEKYGGHYVAIGGGPEILEGDLTPGSYVIGAWPSMDAARAFWNSPEYDALRRARIENGWGDFKVLLVPALPQADTNAPILKE